MTPSIKINNNPVAHEGGLLWITEDSKADKTRFITHLITSSLLEDSAGFIEGKKQPLDIFYFATYHRPERLKDMYNDIALGSGLTVLPNVFISNLRSYDAEMRKATMLGSITEKAGLVIIDYLDDFVSSVNNTIECESLVNYLFNALHPNMTLVVTTPKYSYPSELDKLIERKCEAKIIVSGELYTLTVACVLNRDGNEFEPTYF